MLGSIRSVTQRHVDPFHLGFSVPCKNTDRRHAARPRPTAHSTGKTLDSYSAARRVVVGRDGSFLPALFSTRRSSHFGDGTVQRFHTSTTCNRQAKPFLPASQHSPHFKTETKARSEAVRQITCHESWIPTFPSSHLPWWLHASRAHWGSGPKTVVQVGL